MKQPKLNSRGGPAVRPATFATTRAHVLAQLIGWQRREGVTFVRHYEQEEVVENQTFVVPINTEVLPDEIADLATAITEALVSADMLKKGRS